MTKMAVTVKMDAEMMLPVNKMKEPLADRLATSMSAKGYLIRSAWGEQNVQHIPTSEPAFSQ